MSCHDARERLSELIDDALDPGTRAAVDAHVSGCPECRRELDRLERTVVLLRAVEPVRAPVGFVDRVVAAAKPVPWYRRVRERLARVRPFGVPIGSGGPRPGGDVGRLRVRAHSGICRRRHVRKGLCTCSPSGPMWWRCRRPTSAAR